MAIDTTTQATPVTDVQTFTKAEVDVLLAQTKKDAETTIDGIRAAARAAVSAAQGAAGSVDSYIADATKLNAADDLQRAALGRVFGKGSSGKEAQQLMSENPAKYRVAREAARRLGSAGGETNA